MIKWILDNHKSLGIKIKELTWTNTWAPGVYEYSASYFINGFQVVGHGTSLNKVEALSKAVAEVIERTVMLENKLNSSNGIAAHTNKDLAIKAAENELLERHIYMKSHLEELPLLELNLDDYELDKPFEKFVSIIKKNNIVLKAYLIGQYDNNFCVKVVSHCENFNFGISLGLAFEVSLKDSLQKALQESLRRIVWVKESCCKKNITLEDFKKINYYTHDDHKYLALNPLFAKNYLEFLEKRTSNQCPVFSNVKIYFDELSSTIETPLYFMRAFSSEIQDLVLGKGSGRIPHCLA